MKVAKEFKFWNQNTRVSQGYFAEVNLSEFPKQLEDYASESLDTNEEVYNFLAYLALRRSYGQALRESVIDQDQYDQLLAPFSQEVEFEKNLPRMLKDIKKSNNALQVAAGG